MEFKTEHIALSKKEEQDFKDFAEIMQDFKENGETAGGAGLTWQPSEGEGNEVVEIGYSMKRQAWCNGYAQEAAGDCKKYAFDVLDTEACGEEEAACTSIKEVELAELKEDDESGE